MSTRSQSGSRGASGGTATCHMKLCPLRSHPVRNASAAGTFTCEGIAAIDGHAETVHGSSQACRLRSKNILSQYCCHFHLTVFIIPPVVFMMRVTASTGIKYSICLALLVLYSLGFDTPSWNLKTHSFPPAVLSAWMGGRADVQTHNTYCEK